MAKALDDIRAERERQQTEEGWTPEHDDEHDRGEMAAAAACYAAPFRVFRADRLAGRAYETFTSYVDGWPWADAWWKPKDPERRSIAGRRRDLVRAGALIVAEIERLDRAAK